ncbi:MAG: PIN domain-containing protein [Syntrophales bacterium]
MKALLDTNILIHREAPVVVHQDIGKVFLWLDRLGYEKCIHPISVEEIQHHEDHRVRRSFEAKVSSYRVLRVPAPLAAEVQALSDAADFTVNDRNDSKILNEVFTDRVDILITEDRNIHKKAAQLVIADRVLTIDAFLEKAFSENPELIDYKVLSVKKELMGNLNVAAPFFDDYRDYYPQFNHWFNRKSEEPAYVCFADDQLAAFLYLKLEDHREPYPNILPILHPKRRLKIGSFRVELNGFKLGERFLKIVFDNAIMQRVDEIYITIFPISIEQVRLIRLLEDFGFIPHGEKQNTYGNESVYLRDMTPMFNSEVPTLTFPYVSRSARTFLVPIYQRYHTELLPDSILRTESPDDYVEHEPHRNAISKVYISRSIYRDLNPGDIIVFYRTGGYYESVITTLGIVENVHLRIQNEEQFIRLCRKRSVFTDDQLRNQWRYNVHSRPFIVNFLYAYSFPRRPNMASLIEHGVIRDYQSAPRGFERINREQFETIIRLSETDTRIVVN